MPAVFQIVSRSSGMALSLFGQLPGSADDPVFVVQTTQNDQDPTQMWVLRPQDPEDFLIQPFTSSDFAIGVSASGITDLLGMQLALKPSTDGQVWRISRRLANPQPYFFFLEASNDLLMEVAGGSSPSGATAGTIQIFTRTEHPNQQWTFLPVFAQLGNDG